MTDLSARPPGFRFAHPDCDPAQTGTQWVDPALEQPRQLKFWTCYRSGAAMSVSGIDVETQRTIIITGVTSLGPDAESRLMVSDATGQRWQLVL